MTAPARDLTLDDAVAAVAAEAADHAKEVDRDARFPDEGIAELRRFGLLGALVPADMGGMGLGLVDLVRGIRTVAAGCGSTAMIWAMHCIQVACLVDHGGTPYLRDSLREVAEGQLMLASVTSEVGIGGDIRTSTAAVTESATGCHVKKSAPTVSYGDHADGFLLTARRGPSAGPSEQVLVMLNRSQVCLDRTGGWDTLGLRGTVSCPFEITAKFQPDQVFPTPFGDIAARTMLPVSHLLWAACWSGMANAACQRARHYLRRRGRTASPVGQALAEVHLSDGDAELSVIDLALADCLQAYLTSTNGGSTDNQTAPRSLGVRLNQLKVISSERSLAAAEHALTVCGMAGYSESSPFSVARMLRDLHSARIMISNDRLREATGHLLTAGLT